MKVLLLAGATFGLSGAAFAADMPVKAPVIPQAMYNWSGFYAGVNAGYGGGYKDWSGINYPASGALAGVTVGANQQVGNVVFGFEGDIAWSGMRGSVNEFILVPFSTSPETQTRTSKIEAIASVAGRLGIAVDRLFVYGKGGLAWAQEAHTASQIDTVLAVPPRSQTVTLAGNETRVGPMFGVGAEYALLGNWSVKAEYNYFDFTSLTNTVDMRGTITSFVGVTTNTRQLMHIDERLHIAKVGLNYNFGPHRQPDIAPVRTSRSYDWTGFYIGGEGADGRQPVRWIGFAPFDHYTATGSLGGVVAGARVQPSLFVAGVEAEWMGGKLTGGRSDVTFVSPFLSGTQTLASRFDQIAMATAQVGLPVLDRLLVYGKAGVALAHGTHTDNDFILGSPAVTNSIFLNQGDVWHTGAVLGAGAEYAFFGNWSAKLEYNWIHFYDQQVYLPGTFTEILPARGTGTGTLPTSATLGTSLQLVKLGINYRFGPDVVRAKF